jgi:hypothetical protein
MVSPSIVRRGLVMSDQELPDFPSAPLPDPAGKALDEPHLVAEELEKEIGESEKWDEASEEKDSDPPTS